MFRAPHPGVPTTGVPGVIRFPHHLSDFAGSVIGGGVRFSVDEVMNAGGDVEAAAGIEVATIEIGNAAGVVAFHVVNDGKVMAVAGGVPFGAAGRTVNCR